ncbi:glycosyltransferase [Acidisphaera sp. L21]|uniref:glycosyltransferase n=1 Tax=Acidisphaera sp. L21 TaxID=1641851 RepID=UPI00131B544A|nr:glycosyltransferase [Acidisphaera sp. L21]
MELGVLDRIFRSNHYFSDDRQTLTELIGAWQEIEPATELAQILRLAYDTLVAGLPEQALAHLEYAQRKAPSHSLMTLFIGDLRLSLGRANAAEPFDLLARRRDWRGAWFRLAVSHARAGDLTRAAAALQETLGRNAPETGAAFWAFAADIADRTAAHGWCGFSNHGHLTIGGAAARYDPADVRFELDGQPITLQRDGQSDTPIARYRTPAALAGRHLKILAQGLPLIGSPISLESVSRVEGFVETENGAVQGWAWFPGEPDISPDIAITAQDRAAMPGLIRLAQSLADSAANAQGLIQPRDFLVSADDMTPLAGPVSVRGPHGRALYGSPLNSAAAAQSAMAAAQALARRFPAAGPADRDDDASLPSIPADISSLRQTYHPPDPRRRTLIVIPVYRGLKVTMDCLKTVLDERTSREDVLVISDASPEPALVQALQRVADAGHIIFQHQTENGGFPATANIGLRRAVESQVDVVLLNSDTLVTKGWVNTLRTIAHACDDIGTATPLSNAATIFSYPHADKPNLVPSLQDCQDYARHAATATAGKSIDVPTGHGFCLHIRLECVAETGLLREDVFAQGYGEENDFCMRARALGWRHVAVPSVLVGHLEGQSFAAAKTGLTMRNLKILNRLYPGYDRLIATWQAADPLADSRRAIDLRRWAANRPERGAVLFVTHDRAGGVLRHVEQTAALAERAGYRAIICQPTAGAGRVAMCSFNADGGIYPNLIFDPVQEIGGMRAFLQASGIIRTEIHHFLGHLNQTIELIAGLGPYEIHVHDYSWYCPRITLTAERDRYCGEPGARYCAPCIEDRGTNLGYYVTPDTLRERSQALFSGAGRIVAPSEDVGRRVNRWFGTEPAVMPWEDESEPLALKSIPALHTRQTRRICLAGAIGYEKGYDVLLDCARMVAERDVPIEFVVVGFTCDDQRLLRTGRVRITGQYEEAEAVDLLKQQDADFGFLPALWPETWSYVLTQFWLAALPVVTFDIGTPSLRIKARDGGFILPFGASTKRIVDTLLTLKTA